MSSLLDNFSEAESYECSSSLERTDGLQLINIIAPKRGSKILDLGCGTGYHSKVLADLVGPYGKVVGIDPDTERLQLAKEKYSASTLSIWREVQRIFLEVIMIWSSAITYCTGVMTKTMSSHK